MKKVFIFSCFLVLLPLLTKAAHPSRMYLIGDATSSGWSLDDAALMETVSDGIYEWVGDLNAGALKFVCQKDFLPSYGPSENNTPLVVGTMDLMIRTSYDDADNVFAVTAGRWFLRIDLTSETPQIIVADGVGLADKGYTIYYPATLYAIGTATAVGWSASDAIGYPETGFNSGLYKGHLTLNSGELKFLNQKDWGAGFGATVSNDLIAASGVYAIEALNDSDKKFVVDIADTIRFEIIIDLVSGTLTLKRFPDELFILGPAVGGWSLDNNAIAMKSISEGVYTWSGQLLSGELKFFAEKDFGSVAYGSAIAGTVLACPGEYAIEVLGEEDKKFIANEGAVTLTVDLLSMTITCEKSVSDGIESIAANEWVKLYDITGMLRAQAKMQDLNVECFERGIYIIKASTHSEKIIVK